MQYLQSNPKFRHNLIFTYSDKPKEAYIVASHSTFQVSQKDAQEFLKIRSFCTGYNEISAISEKSGISTKKINKILQSLYDADMFRRPARNLTLIDKSEIVNQLLVLSKMWGKQLEETYIAADLNAGDSTKNSLIGWLFETYHYIKNFPQAIWTAYKYAADTELKNVYAEYYRQEQGHEKFILECLIRLGFKQDEIVNSIPLVATRLICLMMDELFKYCPESLLLIANIIESNEDSTLDDFRSFRLSLEKKYSLPDGSLIALQKHSELDYQLGHASLAKKHEKFLYNITCEKIHILINLIHDIKHAFDAQSMEIKEYYNQVGNYIPRQPVDYFSI